METLKRLLLFTIVAAVLAGGSYYWYFNIYKRDGVDCERNVHCPHRVCLTDQRGSYCSRPCESDAECLPGWRCLTPPGPYRDNKCVRPQTTAGE